MNYPKRRERLQELLREEGAEGFLLINIEGSDALNLRYLTGFSGSFGLLFLTPDGELLLTDSRYLERARREAPALEVLEVKGNWLDRLAEKLAELGGVRRWGINSLTISLHNYTKLQEKLKDKAKGKELELLPLEGPVERLRLRKDEEELAHIRRAVELTDRAFEHALEVVRPGMTERELAWELEKFMRECGSDGLAFPIIVAAGENSALPHATPSERRLKRGDLLLLDLGARWEGYCADLTRMVSLGEPTARQLEVYEVVLRAQEAAIEGIRPGMSGLEADELARRVIREAGFGERFGHGLGHGVGLAVHEGPRLSPLAEKEQPLEPGMVVTIEPAIYLTGEFGVRIEDLAVVREDGLEVLTRAPKGELRSVPV